MMKTRFPLLVILLLPVLVCALAWYCWFSPVTTVYLVRHAERLNDTDTTSISEAGIARAFALSHALSASGLRRIYVSQKQRTEQTAAPTADRFGISIVRIQANAIDVFADSVTAHRGDAILIVGHSDTVPQILGKLGIKQPPAIGKETFDDLFVVTVFRFRTTLTHLKYGSSL